MAKMATKAMFVFYCLGVAATGLALCGALFGMVVVRRLTAISNVTLTTVSQEAKSLVPTPQLTHS